MIFWNSGQQDESNKKKVISVTSDVVIFLQLEQWIIYSHVTFVLPYDIVVNKSTHKKCGNF